MLEFSQVKKIYNKSKVALNDISFKVNSGEILGFIGHNGAGKTTSIKIIIGLTNPDQGDVKIFGKSVVKESQETKKIIGYLSDNPNNFLYLKGIEYLNFVADMYEVSKEERSKRIEELSNRFEIKKVLNNQIKSYSHGMKQKLMIIASIMHQPKLWILDEPMTGLDPKAMNVLKSLMREHADKGNIVFFSSHGLELVENICDRIGFLNKGDLLISGTMEDILKEFEGETLEDIFLKVVS